MDTIAGMRRFGVVVGLSAGVLAGLTGLYQLADVLWRVALFLFVSHGASGANHSDEFGQIYRMDVWAIPLGLLATVLLWRQGKKRRLFGVGVVLANLLGAIAFFVMHETGILVTYDEFIQRSGPPH